MKAEVGKFFLMAVVTCFSLACLQSPAFGQCGVPGTPPCQPIRPQYKRPLPTPKPIPRIPQGEDISRLKKEDISDSDELIDQFGKITTGDLKARLDNFLVNLMNDPNTVGIIVVYGKDQEIASRVSTLKKYISMRKFNSKRIEYRRGSSKNSAGFLTKFYRRSRK